MFLLFLLLQTMSFQNKSTNSHKGGNHKQHNDGKPKHFKSDKSDRKPFRRDNSSQKDEKQHRVDRRTFDANEEQEYKYIYEVII